VDQRRFGLKTSAIPGSADAACAGDTVRRDLVQDQVSVRRIPSTGMMRAGIRRKRSPAGCGDGLWLRIRCVDCEEAHSWPNHRSRLGCSLADCPGTPDFGEGAPHCGSNLQRLRNGIPTRKDSTAGLAELSNETTGFWHGFLRRVTGSALETRGTGLISLPGLSFLKSLSMFPPSRLPLNLTISSRSGASLVSFENRILER
jgi:hypothetical protein